MAEPTLTDKLRDHVAANGRASVTFDKPPTLVIVGEWHARLAGDPSSVRATASVRLLKELLTDQRFRYFGNESFLNAGPVRLAIREYWRNKKLPPAFNPEDKEKLAVMEIARRVLARRFQPVLDVLRVSPRYILSIGTRSEGKVRDARIAMHFLEEVADRKIKRNTPGVILTGASHAAAVPLYNEQSATTRMIFERNGFVCISILVVTDFIDTGSDPDDQVRPSSDPSAPGVRLTALATKTPISFNTAGSPFANVIWGASTSGHSLAAQFEIVVLQKA
jgi:hypothetical protein